MRWIVRALAAAFVLAAGMGQAQAPGAKLALVVGVSDYGRERAAQEAAGFVVPPPLANAVRDAELVASALESKGFTVTRATNPDKRALLSAVNTFAASLNRAGGDAVGLFYFAGHGAQGRPALERDIDNYLIPLGADLATEVDLESEALALSRISAALRPAPQGAVVLIIDACRDFALPAASRSGLVTRGLAEARAAPGTIIAYATSPGATALDALPGQQNGPYATALAAEIRAAQGSTVEAVFIAVRNKVLQQTRESQVPWENSSLRRSVLIGALRTRSPSIEVNVQLADDARVAESFSLYALQRSLEASLSESRRFLVVGFDEAASDSATASPENHRVSVRISRAQLSTSDSNARVEGTMTYSSRGGLKCFFVVAETPSAIGGGAAPARRALEFVDLSYQFAATATGYLVGGGVSVPCTQN